MKKHLFALCIILSVAACSRDKKVDQVKFPQPVEKADEEIAVQEVALSAPPPPSANMAMKDAKGRSDLDDQQSDTDVDKKLIKEGSISFETSDLAKTKQLISQSLKALGGYITEENQSNSIEENRNEMIVNARVPAQKFDAFIDSISAAASHIDSKNIRVSDVTTQYIDLTTRLNNQHALENRYKELLAKAGKMSDVLEIEEKLNNIRTEIESNQGQLNYLNKQVTYSALEITFYTKKAALNSGDGFGYRIKTAITGGWQILQNLFFGIITLWPVMLILILVIWLFRRWRRKRKARQVEL